MDSVNVAVQQGMSVSGTLTAPGVSISSSSASFSNTFNANGGLDVSGSTLSITSGNTFSSSGGSTFNGNANFYDSSGNLRFSVDGDSVDSHNVRFYANDGLTVSGSTLVANNAFEANDGFTVKNGMNVYHDTSTIIIEADSNGVDIHNVQLKANNGLTVSGGTMYVDNNMQVASGKTITLTNYGDLKTKIDDLHDEIDDIDSCDHVSSCVNDNCYIYFGWSDSCDTCSNIHRWGRINGAWNDYQIYSGTTLRGGSNNDNNNWDNSYAGISWNGITWIGINLDNDVNGDDRFWQSFRCH
jgi:hypothetical protein